MARATKRAPEVTFKAAKPAEVTTVTTHPVAMAEARKLAGDVTERPVVSVDERTALIQNRPGLMPPDPPPPARRKRDARR